MNKVCTDFQLYVKIFCKCVNIYLPPVSRVFHVFGSFYDIKKCLRHFNSPAPQS